MVTKRGQAAMEFLMTYGWALLVVLVAIGALAFFGVLNPGQFLPASCNLFPGLGCTDFKIDDATPHATLIIQNGLGDDLIFKNFVLGGDNGLCGEAAVETEIFIPASSVTACGVGSYAAGTCILGDGKTAKIAMACGTPPLAASVGSKFKSDVTITYLLGTSTLQHSKTGQIVTAIE